MSIVQVDTSALIQTNFIQYHLFLIDNTDNVIENVLFAKEGFGGHLAAKS
jgi:hypothetical protein